MPLPDIFFLQQEAYALKQPLPPSTLCFAQDII
jgi:hypothetical protein